MFTIFFTKCVVTHGSFAYVLHLSIRNFDCDLLLMIEICSVVMRYTLFLLELIDWCRISNIESVERIGITCKKGTIIGGFERKIKSNRRMIPRWEFLKEGLSTLWWKIQISGKRSMCGLMRDMNVCSWVRALEYFSINI